MITLHWAQMALARRSRSDRSSLPSATVGGKNTTDCGPRQAARICHSTPSATALTTIPCHEGDHRTAFEPAQDEIEDSFPAGNEPPLGGLFARLGARRGRLGTVSRIPAIVAVSLVADVDGRHLQQQPVDAGDPYRLARRDG